ncbi:hypothetical protein, variant 1 [Phytophthora nicotianae INRA-310]|uniref:Uncharacterized protein n=4 Tax=Phytophthora nicotianae TaxID=4792 RepID=W2Q0A4_PHYN3|nr:hypothetical protein, variant 1 [Phytophthora nicotianae INRA-310]ETI43072.1 hypothetical protein, variant 1 [Phytophthora nicotianae P1569]ETM42989.1 hypothetical protein, variant 1 [Phytophthora nicotianae]ETN06648.1 hypothetical protein, variant 1 [Phytophthora nicotianae INRA-310]ETO71709.1 hypothetical protein, variant 1 [Phytophthora nicotianae P1976]
MRRRPREVPVAKPSAVHNYVPNVLLRAEEHGSHRRWLPNERKPGASKHSTLNQQQDVMKIKVDMNEYCSEAEVDKLNALEEEVAILESEMEKFVEEFYMAAAMFSTQATAQKTLIERLKAAQSSSNIKPSE